MLMLRTVPSPAASATPGGCPPAWPRRWGHHNFREGARHGEIRWFSVESGLQTTWHVAACHRFVTLFRAEKCAKGLEKRNQLRGFGPTLLWCGPGAGLASTGLRIPTSLLTEVGFPTSFPGPSFQFWGLVRAWCGPGAGLAILCWAQDCSLNPAVGAGLLHPFLRSQQDCPGALPAARAWSCSCPRSLVMEPALL